MTEQEFLDWLSFFEMQPMNIQEAQMAMLLAMTGKAYGGDVSMTDFMFTYQPEETEETQISGKELDALLMNMYGGK